MDTWVLMWLLIAVCALSLLIGAGIGHFQGYVTGFKDGAREQKFKNYVHSVLDKPSTIDYNTNVSNNH